MDIELGDAVAAIRDELLAAVARGADENLRFVVGPVELSFEVELRADAKAKAGFKAWVVTGDVEAGGSRARKQKVTITLTPKNRGGGDVLVGSDDHDRGPGDVFGHTGR
ncbi:trypco2 family protein [Nocardia sp. BMG111209]|uniref:trypco2 family protein n=1 Tax=Nocardia sp. BMG111209 TaxID=1160137 RepID=UPI000374206A|nr:trypco2 family protein [Nocardia sp. BMG111209]